MQLLLAVGHWNIWELLTCCLVVLLLCAGVVLRVDSPGGDALASDLMWREIKKLAEKKPVVACMGDVAASGGYYMSMAAQVGVSVCVLGVCLCVSTRDWVCVGGFVEGRCSSEGFGSDGQEKVGCC